MHQLALWVHCWCFHKFQWSAGNQICTMPIKTQPSWQTLHMVLINNKSDFIVRELRKCWARSPLVQIIIAWRMFGAESLHEPMLTFCQFDTWHKFLGSLHGTQKLSLRNMHRKISIAKYRPFCINTTSTNRNRNWIYNHPWWRHDIETFSALLILCKWNLPSTGDSHHKGSVMCLFHAFLLVCWTICQL